MQKRNKSLITSMGLRACLRRAELRRNILSNNSSTENRPDLTFGQVSYFCNGVYAFEFELISYTQSIAIFPKQTYRDCKNRFECFKGGKNVSFLHARLSNSFNNLGPQMNDFNGFLLVAFFLEIKGYFVEKKLYSDYSNILAYQTLK